MSIQVMAQQAVINPLSDEDKVAAVVKAVVRTAEMWNLTNAEASAIFDVSTATWSRMKSGAFHGSLDRDKITRASLIIGIFKGLRLLFNGPLTMAWPTLENNGVGFDGRRPVDIMKDGGIPAMLQMRKHIDALRGGL